MRGNDVASLLMFQVFWDAHRPSSSTSFFQVPARSAQAAIEGKVAALASCWAHLLTIHEGCDFENCSCSPHPLKLTSLWRALHEVTSAPSLQTSLGPNASTVRTFGGSPVGSFGSYWAVNGALFSEFLAAQAPVHSAL